MDHAGVAPPVFVDPRLDMGGVRDEAIHARGTGHIPLAQVVDQARHHRPLHRPRVAAIDVILIPQIAHGRVRVAQVQRIGRRDHTLGRAAFAGQHEVIARQVQFLERAGHERQVVLVKPGREGFAANRSQVDRLGIDKVRDLGRVIGVGENVGLREHAEKRLQHLLSAAHSDQPVMNDGDAGFVAGQAQTANPGLGGLACRMAGGGAIKNMLHTRLRKSSRPPSDRPDSKRFLPGSDRPRPMRRCLRARRRVWFRPTGRRKEYCRPPC